MARKRMIDPAIWDSEQVMDLSPNQFKIYIFLISQADDEGRLKVAMQIWRTRIFPFDQPIAQDFENDVNHIIDVGLLISYWMNDEMYMYHPNWRKYQWLNRPTESKLPTPTENSQRTHREVTANRIEKKRKEKKIPTDISSTKQSYAEAVRMTEAEYEKLCTRFGADQTKKLIDKLNHWKLEKGKTYKSDYHAMFTWVIEACGLKEKKSRGWKCPKCGKTNTHNGRYCLDPECGYEFIENEK